MTNVKIEIDAPNVILSNHGLGKSGPVQKLFTNEVLRISDAYTPSDSTMLKTLTTFDDNFEGYTYNSPYARYHWYGKLMVDPVYGKGAFFNENYGFWSRPGIKKVESDREMQYQGAPMRGPKWVDRAWIDNSSIVIGNLQKLVDKGGK